MRITKLRAFTLILALAAALLAWRGWRFRSPVDADWVTRIIAQHYRVQVRLGTFHAAIFPALAGSGDDLRFFDPRASDATALVRVRHFSFTGSWRGLLRHPPTVERVELEGLQLTVPPRRVRAPGAPPPAAPASTASTASADLLLRAIAADGALVSLRSGNPARPPRDFLFDRLRLQSVGRDTAMRFDAVLRNPTPPGRLAATGFFGPWNASDPAASPLRGEYVFEHADLGALHGIAGTLSSHGNFLGALGRIEVQGATDTPNFALARRGGPVHLTTRFHAIVDGESGDTRLDPVTARWGRSTVTARGAAVRLPGRGESIELDLTAPDARIEDALRLALPSSEPLLSGAMQLTAHLTLPPGDADVMQRLRLVGAFGVDQAVFADSQVEDKLNDLSRRGLGEKDVPQGERTVFHLRGRFDLHQQVMHFESLSFGVPGAAIALSGDYGLATEAMNFTGTLVLQARLSQMVSGMKSALVRPLDRFFSGPRGGTELPLRITGTRTHPLFAVDIRHAIHR